MHQEQEYPSTTTHATYSNGLSECDGSYGNAEGLQILEELEQLRATILSLQDYSNYNDIAVAI